MADISHVETKGDNTIQTLDRVTLLNSPMTTVELNRLMPLSLCVCAFLRKTECV